MKIVFLAVEGGNITNMRYEADDYTLGPYENVYPGTVIPFLTPGAKFQSGQIVDDSNTWDAAQAIPSWAQDLIGVLTAKGVIDVTDLSADTQNVIAVKSTPVVIKKVSG